MFEKYKFMKNIINNKLSIVKAFPSLLTITSLLLGLFAIDSAVNNNPILSIYLILLASICDLLDGRIARVLKVTSDFGGELDSLSDFITFGVAPAFVMYYCLLYNDYPLGWISICLYIVAAILRLARFNVLNKTSDSYSNYFSGIPVPAAAGLLFLPFYLTFGFNITINTTLVCIYSIIIALLMISAIPTISTKNMKLSKNLFHIHISLLTVIILCLIYYTWVVMLFCALIYIASIPVTIFLSFFNKKSLKKTR